MCGIVGFYHSNKPAETYPDTICQMLALMWHRGPDEMGYYFDDNVALGTARLSIIDLSTGQQPLSDATGRYWISYNGEVYNYIELRAELEQLGVQFATTSDTEVVLQAYIQWGERSFDKLNGGFAIAIYDRQTGTLVLVRDRYGKRPLYYSRNGDEWVYASEIKCFLGHGEIALEFDETQLASILSLWTPLPHQSGYRGIEQLPEGSYLRLCADGTHQIRPYYTLDFAVEQAWTGNEADAVEQVREALTESTRIRLRSDVEVGTYLSGGLDSTITTLLTKQLSNHDVRTFSVSFEEGQFDESADQQAMSSHIKTKHRTVRVSNEDIANALPDALWHGEVPVFRTAFVPMYLLSQQVKADGIKVVLTGEGADESFLGYNIFKETALRAQWGQLDSEAEKRERLANLYPYQEHFQRNPAALVGLYDSMQTEREHGLFSHEMRFRNAPFTLRLLAQRVGDPFAAIRPMIESSAEFPPLNPIQRAQWLEFKTLLGGYLLSTQGDRMSFANGVESRMPFLDPNVVHLAWALPTALKLNGHDEKYILKRAFADVLPPHIIKKPKQPYRAPDAQAFLTENAPDYLELLLSENELQKVGVINSKFAHRLYAKLKNSTPDRISQRENQTFIFLLSLVLLHNQFIENPRAVPAPESIDGVLVRRIDGRRR